MRKFLIAIALTATVAAVLVVAFFPGLKSFANRLLVSAKENCSVCHSKTTDRQEEQPPASARAPIRNTYRDSFSNGEPQLNWYAFPGFSPDEMGVVARNDTPEDDGWAGRVTNQSLGGFASLSYTGHPDLSDYSIEAWIYVIVTPSEQGSLHGLAIRVDPEGQRFYRFASQFGSEQKLTIAYVGSDTNNFPVFIKEWDESDIPGGAPKSSGWHKMKVRAVGNNFWAYWDDHELPDCPISNNRIRAGYFGVYTNFTGGANVTQTLVDQIVVRQETQEARH